VLFRSELAVLERMQAAKPSDLELRFRIADTRSWLGRVAEQQGEFAEAGRHYDRQAALLEELVRLEPRTARWRFKLADEYLIQTDLDLVTDRAPAAGERLVKARRLLDELVTLDTANRRWTATRLEARLREAFLARRQGNLTRAIALTTEVRPELELLVASEPSSRGYAQWLAKAWMLETQLSAGTDPAAVAVVAKRAVDVTESLVHDGRATRVDVAECAQACLVAGEAAAKAGNTALAQQHWQRAGELLGPRLPGSRDWRLLDPAARAAAALGRIDEARSIVALLDRLGYIPLDPWPPAIAPGVPGINPPER
jgi:tetratricopeptide (TPR) repeat protein